jgi:hypothetical protein
MSAATGLMIDGERTSGQVGTCLILQARAVQHTKDLALLAVAVSYWYISLLCAPAAVHSCWQTAGRADSKCYCSNCYRKHRQELARACWPRQDVGG